ncbi:MAG: DUF6236 family protein [Actinomycetota bacterium]|nr:DUF6236 family protein [Actinomycetota bacterium]
MTPRIGLYYPYAHFRSDEWLKVAALYWPKMARIVPAGYEMRDSDVTRALADSLDFVVNLSPRTGLSGASQMMMDALTQHGLEMSARYGLVEESDAAAADGIAALMRAPLDTDSYVARVREEGPIDSYVRVWQTGDYTRAMVESYARAMVGSLADTPFSLAGLYSYRMTRELAKELRDRDLARPLGNMWLAMHPDIAWVYMCVLAERLAAHNNLSAITDQIAAFHATPGWTSAQIAAALQGNPQRKPVGDSASAVGMLAVRLVVPANSRDLSVKKVVAVRQKYATEFDAFHELVNTVAAQLCDHLSADADSAVLDAYLKHEVQRQFDQPLRGLRKALRGAGIDTILATGSMKFQIPAAAGVGALLANESALGAAGAVAFGIVSVARSFARQRADMSEPSAASYLWHLERKVSPRSLIKGLLRMGPFGREAGSGPRRFDL